MTAPPERDPPSGAERRPLDAGSLNGPLAITGRLWREIRVVDETGSTNADVAAAARSGLPEGLVVVAERQSAGRGRLDRRWESPRSAGLTFSTLLRPTGVPTRRWPWLPLMAGVALAEALTRTAPVQAQLKWPNDVMLGDRKVAGILVERVQPAGPEGDAAAVVGMGINVSTTAAELPDASATSLLMFGLRGVDRAALLRAVLRTLESLYAGWVATAGDPDASGLRQAYERRSVTIGSEVEVARPNGRTLRGAATAVDEGARLVLRCVDGTEAAVAAGDVHRVR